MGVRVVLTAGFDRATHVVALAELAVRDGHQVAAVLVVSPFRLRRLGAFVRQRGAGAVLSAAGRLMGARGHAGAGPDPMEAFFEANRLSTRSLKIWCRAHRVPYRSVSDLNDPKAIEVVTSAESDGVIYGGGGILRSRFLEGARGRVLNAHSGPLPQIRGMNACEWSILLGYEPCVTIHVIDRGVDTGGAIERLPLPVEPGDDLPRLRSKCAVLGVVGLRRALPLLTKTLPTAARDAGSYRQCYVMADAIRELTERRLASRLAHPARSGR